MKMENTAAIATALAQLAPYIEKICIRIGEALTEAQRNWAVKLFKAASDEIYRNLGAVSKLLPTVDKTWAINSPQIRRIAAKDLQTACQEKCAAFAETFPQLKAKDTKRLFDRISLALHKIEALRGYSAKSDKELARYGAFRPAVRLKNIRAVYLEISKLLK